MAERLMKDSGLKSIGTIPDTWKINRLKYLGKLSGGMSNKKPEDFGEGTPFVSYGDIYKNIMLKEAVSGKVKATENDINKYSVKYGDTFFTGSSETVDELGLSSTCLKTIENATFNGFSIRFRPQCLDEYNPNFYKYYYRSEATRTYLTALDNSITRANLSQSTLGNLPVVKPPLEEQTKIANFLDKKVSEIDNAIEKTKQSIEEYKKLKQAIITETVTKGLDPDVEMKDSGIEWIGKVPSSWNIKPLKRVLHERQEKNSPVKTTERLSLSIGLGITLYSEKTTNLDRFKDDFEQYKIAHVGDLVLNSMNMIVGATGVSNYYGCVSPAYYTLYDDEPDHITTKYYEYLFLTQKAKDLFHSYGKGIYAIERGDGRVNTCRLKVSREDLMAFNVSVPPIQEQRRICHYLENKTYEYNELIKKKELLIKELEQYKKSLIYEYVTGKKEVA